MSISTRADNKTRLLSHLIFNLGTVLVLVWCLTISAVANAAPKSDLWDRWLNHNPNSTTSINHNTWDILLKKYVYPFEDGQYRVAYISVHDIDQRALDDYISYLIHQPVSGLNRDEQLVYWINLYNALTVQLILNVYPVATIRDIDISPGLFSNGPWDKKLVVIEGEDISLNDIEHRILRPIWDDPRIHYALNCAALGCPNLGTKAFTADNADQYLSESARAFINHPRGVRVVAGKLYVSSIYDWFMEDFGGTQSGVLAHLREFADPALSRDLAHITTIEDDDYDWALNSVEPTITLKIRKRGS